MGVLTRTMEYPFTAEIVKGLRTGQRVSLSGRIFTGRDRLHRYLAEGGNCPAGLENSAIYHCGPVVVKSEGRWLVKAAGPTTSMRQDPFVPWIVEHLGVRVFIGKGGLGEASVEAFRNFGCVYLQAVGGAAGYLARHILNVNAVYFLKEFGQAEAMWELVVRDLEAVVTIDSNGCSLHKRLACASQKKLKDILKQKQG